MFPSLISEAPPSSILAVRMTKSQSILLSHIGDVLRVATLSVQSGQENMAEAVSITADCIGRTFASHQNASLETIGLLFGGVVKENPDVKAEHYAAFASLRAVIGTEEESQEVDNSGNWHPSIAYVPASIFDSGEPQPSLAACERKKLCAESFEPVAESIEKFVRTICAKRAAGNSSASIDSAMPTGDASEHDESPRPNFEELARLERESARHTIVEPEGGLAAEEKQEHIDEPSPKEKELIRPPREEVVPQPDMPTLTELESALSDHEKRLLAAVEDLRKDLQKCGNGGAPSVSIDILAHTALMFLHSKIPTDTSSQKFKFVCDGTLDSFAHNVFNFGYLASLVKPLNIPSRPLLLMCNGKDDPFEIQFPPATWPMVMGARFSAGKENDILEHALANGGMTLLRSDQNYKIVRANGSLVLVDSTGSVVDASDPIYGRLKGEMTLCSTYVDLLHIGCDAKVTAGR
jgi:hypothetical protein